MREDTSPVRRAAVVGISIVLLSVPGCGGDDIVFPRNERPFIYLVLNQTTGATGEPVQTALLLTMVRADSAEYRTADVFRMRRTSDGAAFDWRNEPLFGGVEFDRGSDLRLSEGNYVLSDTATDRGLGFEELEPGGTYDLRVETEGEVIRGRVTVPDTFSISLVERGDDLLAVWPDVRGAAGFSVTAVGDDLQEPVFQTDTTFRIRPGTRSLTVRAADPHAFRYATDESTRRSGVEGALGVFGAVQTAERP